MPGAPAPLTTSVAFPELIPVYLVSNTADVVSQGSDRRGPFPSSLLLLQPGCMTCVPVHALPAHRGPAELLPCQRAQVHCCTGHCMKGETDAHFTD